MNVEVYAPSDFAGDLMGDLNGRRGRIAGMDAARQRHRDPRPGADVRDAHLRAAPHVDHRRPRQLPHGVLALRGRARARSVEDHRRVSRRSIRTATITPDLRSHDAQAWHVSRRGISLRLALGVRTVRAGAESSSSKDTTPTHVPCGTWRPQAASITAAIPLILTLNAQRRDCRLTASVTSGPKLGPRLTTPCRIRGDPGSPRAVTSVGEVVANRSCWYPLDARRLYVFGDLAPLLVPRFRVLGLSARGCGASGPASDGYGLDLQIRELIGLLDELRIERATFAGHSASGGKVIRLARQFPQRVARIVTFDIIYDDVPDQFEAEFQEALGATAPSLSLESYRRDFEAWELGTWSPALERDFVERTESLPDGTIRYRSQPPEWQHAFIEDVRAGRYHETAIACPALFFVAHELDLQRIKQFPAARQRVLRPMAEAIAQALSGGNQALASPAHWLNLQSRRHGRE